METMFRFNDLCCLYLVACLLLLLSRRAYGFYISHRSDHVVVVSHLASSPRKNDHYSENNLVESSQTRQSLIRAALELNREDKDSLIQVQLLGRATLPVASGFQNRTCMVVGKQRSTTTRSSTATPVVVPALFIPLENDNHFKLLELASNTNNNNTLPKIQLMKWNSVLLNRDGSLFDNLPWSTWTKDPDFKQRDAAGNPVEAKLHFGKRDAYNRMLGKDWRSYRFIELAREYNEGQGQQSSNDKQQLELARRILELQIRESEMDIAEMDYQIAISRNDLDTRKALESRREEMRLERDQLKEKMTKSFSSQKTKTNSSPSSSWLSAWADKVLGVEPQERKQAPFRGATGYGPMMFTAEDEGDAFSSPYEMMQSVLRDQLNAEVIGAVLENTSLLDGTITIGGALVLRRITPVKEITLAGETIQVRDEEETFGNQKVKGGQIIVVDCDADEVVGMALACGISIQVESSVFERASTMAELVDTVDGITAILPDWKPSDPELSFLKEGQASNMSATERVVPIRLPRTTTSLFDELFRDQGDMKSANNNALFPTDNPIKTLRQYDEMTNDDKARTLMGLSNFNGKLPRPRQLRSSPDGSKSEMNALDKLLLPLIDESVRRQYMIRDAEKRGDTSLAQELVKEKSRRQVALEKAEQARQAGVDDVAEWWETEADLYGSLRADVTQDEGSYSRFLDRDEWYERERRKTAKRMDKKKFGTLLDGIE